MAQESQIGFETGCILTGTAVHVFVLFLQRPKENVNMRWHVKVCQMKWKAKNKYNFIALILTKNTVCDHTCVFFLAVPQPSTFHLI